MGPSSEQAAHFRADLERGLRRMPDGIVALAVSGGPDSMAMLALGIAAYPGLIIAATVDHRLRPESEGEAAMVAAACAARGVPHTTLPVLAPPEGNIQSWARRARYGLLDQWAAGAGAIALCTAHHADDQAETFLMRAARASGLAGLAGVREHVPGPVPIIRPLLAWRRADLRQIAESAGMPFVDDPSNDDPRFDRARFRQWIGEAPWLDPQSIARSAAYLAEADADLRALAEWLWTARAVPAPEGEVRFDVSDLPRGVRRYLARQAIETISGKPLQGGIESLLDSLDTGTGATRAGVQASAKEGLWRFRRAPPRRAPR